MTFIWLEWWPGGCLCLWVFLHQYFVIGAVFGFLFLIFIRLQIGVTACQYAMGMIPHHSMAILMSRKLLERKRIANYQQIFAKQIVKQQQEEINKMKKWC